MFGKNKKNIYKTFLCEEIMDFFYTDGFPSLRTQESLNRMSNFFKTQNKLEENLVNNYFTTILTKEYAL
jgi:hypothetical protein